MAALPAPAPPPRLGTARRGHHRGRAIDHRMRRAASALSAVLAAAAAAAAWRARCFCGGAAAGAPRLPPLRPSASTSLSAWSAVAGPRFLSVEEVNIKQEPVYRKRRGRKWRWSQKRGSWVEIFKREYLPEPEMANSTELHQQLYRMKQMHLLLKFLPGALSSPVYGSDHVISTVRKMWLLRGTLGGKFQKRDEQDNFLNENGHLLEEFTRRGLALLEAAPPEQATADLIYEAIFNIAEMKTLVPQFIPLVLPLTVLARSGADEVDAMKVAKVIGSMTKLRDDLPELRDTLLPTLILHQKWQGWKSYWLTTHPAEHSRVLNALNIMKNEVPYLRSVLET